MLALDFASMGLGGLGLQLLEAAPDGVLVVRADGSIALVNEQLERMFGASRKELLGKPLEVLLPEADRAVHVRHREAYAASPRRRPMARNFRLRARRKSGAEFPVEISLSPAETEIGTVVIAIVRDVTEQRQAEERLLFMSTHDALTALYNRAFFEEQRQKLDRSRSPVGVIVADIDGLKQINDGSGHEMGDRVLRRTAAVLRSTFRETDIVARTGGDEFVVLLPHAGRAELEAGVSRLVSELARHNELHGAPVLRLSVGTSLSHGAGLLRAFREADERMYRAKRRRAARREGVPSGQVARAVDAEEALVE